ncbi:MAG TPA: hypothetical protein VGN33_13785 [Leifsonia sp.]|nr:hypothetical protein [Leifsonia sp.]
MRASDLRTPVRGVRESVHSEPDLWSRCLALSDRIPEGGAFSHGTAAALLDLPVPSNLARADRLHLAVPPPRRASRASGIVGHQLALAGADVVELGRIRVTSPRRTWADLAAHLELGELVALGDAIVHWRSPRASIPELAAEAARLSGRPGAGTARAAAGLLHERSESPQESHLRVALVRAGFPRLQVNVDLRDTDGRFVARPDLRFPDYGVIVEYEGDHHRTDRAQWRRDLSRTAELQALGETVIRIASTGAPTLRLIRRTLLRAGWSPM